MHLKAGMVLGMVIIRILGGLGNQLFQYAAARSLAHYHGQELRLDCTRLDAHKLRSYGLDNFSITAKRASSEQIARFRLSNKHKIVRELYTGWHRLKPHYRRPIYREPHFHYDPYFWKTKNEVYLSGYFVSEKYFTNIRTIIRSEFQVAAEANPANKEMQARIKDTMAVSIHIRRGDYANNPKTNLKFGLCSLEYYQKCMQRLESSVSNPHYFIFSDDISWAKANLKADKPIIFVDINDGRTAYEDLRLMSLCRHHIIANSTFSWWGAWLGNNPDKLIIAPQNWFQHSTKDSKDVYPEEWIRI